MNPERFARLGAVLARRQPDLTVVMDRVNKLHNFSAILRNADAAGVLEAHAVPPVGGLGWHVPGSNETSGGSKKWVRVHEHASLPDAVSVLREKDFRIVAAHPSPDSIPFRDWDYTRPTAILVGAELFGVSEEALALADAHVSIPMMGMVQSLNVSVAAGVLLVEALQQRIAAGLYDESRLAPEEFRRILFEWAYPRLAAGCRRKGDPYPELDEHGEIIGPLRR